MKKILVSAILPILFGIIILVPLFAADNQKVDGGLEATEGFWKKDDTVIFGCVYKQELMPPDTDFPFNRILTYVTIVKTLKGKLEVGDRLRLTSVIEEETQRVTDLGFPEKYHREGKLVYVFAEYSNLTKKKDFTIVK